MFKSDYLEDLFEFNKSFEESVNDLELLDLWKNIEKSKNEYFNTKNKSFLFLIDFQLSQWINLSDKNLEKSKEEKLVELFEDLFVQSKNHPKSQWIILYFMRKYNLNYSPKIKNKINLIITLNENNDTQKLIKYIENTNLDEEKFLLKVKNILLENPQLGSLIIQQINLYFQTDEIFSNLREYNNLDFLITQTFIDCFDSERDFISESNLTKNDCNFFLICDFLNILSDNEIPNKNLKNYLKKVVNECELINSENFPHLIERFYSSILARKNGFLCKRLSNLKWKIEKKKNNDIGDLLIDKKNNCLNVLNCMYSIFLDGKHLYKELFNCDLKNFDYIYDKIKLFYLINKVYKLSKTNSLIEFKFNYDLLQDLVEKRFETKENYVNLIKNNNFNEYLIEKLKWIFKFIKWCMKKIDSDNDDLRQKILKDLLANCSVLYILSKYNFLTILEKKEENFCQTILELIIESKNKSELMLWKGFIVIRLAIIWLIHGATDNLEINKIPLQIKAYIKKILPFTFRVEILENLFSLLFLNQFDILDEINFDEKNTGLDSEKSFVHLTEQSNIIKNKSKSKKQDNLQFSFLKTNDNFIFPNELVSQYISLLKECIEFSQTTLNLLLMKLEPSQIHKLETEFKIESSVANLDDAQKRLNFLKECIVSAEWRFNMIKPAFFENDVSDLSCKNNVDNRKLSFISSSDDYDDIKFEEMQTLHSNSDENDSSKNHNVTNNQSHLSKNFHIIVTHSIISCMLASFDQILRFCLIENQLDKAAQVLKVFENDLVNTKEDFEYFVLLNWQKLEKNVWEIYSSQRKIIKEDTFASNSISELNLFLDNFLNEDNNHKNIDFYYLLIDYSISNSPSIQYSYLILDYVSSFNVKQSKNNENINNFLTDYRKLITTFNTLDQYKNLKFSTVLDTCLIENIFKVPEKIIEELDYKRSLTICIETLQNLLFLNTKESYHEFYQQESNDKKIDLQKLTVEYKRLLYLCSNKKYNYLKLLYHYVRKISKVLQECQKLCKIHTNNDTSETDKYSINYFLRNSSTYFSVLYQCPSAILFSMVVKNRISPNDLDNLAKQMNVNLLSTLCCDLLPTIPTSPNQDEMLIEFHINDCLHPALCKLVSNHLVGSNNESFLIQNYFEDENDSNKTEMNFKNKVIQTNNLIEYFKNKSWILIKIMNILNLIDEKAIQTENFEMRFNENSPLLKWIDFVKQTFDIQLNKKLTSNILILAFYPYFSSGNLTITKCLEKFAEYSDWQKIYKILFLVDTKNENENSSFNIFKTSLLSKIAMETGDVKYALQIKDASKRTVIILDIIEQLHEVYSCSKLALEDLNSLYATLEKSQEGLEDFKLIQEKIEFFIKRVKVYSKIAELSGLRTWKEALENLSEIDILTILKTRRTFKIVIEWNEIRCHKNYEKYNHEDKETFCETEDLLKELLAIAYCEQHETSSLNELLKTDNKPIYLFEKILNLTENLDSKEFIIKQIIEKEKDDSKISYYENLLLGIQMVKCISDDKRQYYVQLINKPQLVFEQMLMNMEFSALEKCVKMKGIFECDKLIEIYARKAVDIVLVRDNSLNGSDITMISSNNIKENNLNFTVPPNISNVDNFTMPISVPSKEQWIPDHDIYFCMACKIERFSMFNRKHHCRRCGRVVCRNCSEKVMIIPKINPSIGVRVCDQCYMKTLEINFQNSHTNRTVRRETASCLSSETRTVSWILSVNDKENEIIKEEFYYEAAPSSSLCLSMLKFHKNKKHCAKVITELFCKPLFEILSFKEIDYSLVINIIKSLVNSAKVIISEEFDCDDLNTKINFLLDRIDIIKMMVDGNCLDCELISLLINNENAFQKVQEKLIEMERFELALNVAAKVGANLKGIWKAWAFVCIKHGKYNESYSIFKKCFQKKSESEANAYNSGLLKEIFSVLESQIVFINLRNIQDRCRLIMNGKSNELINVNNNHMDNSNDTQLSAFLYKQAMYFLENYGCKEDFVRFYIKFKLYKQAIKLCLSESSNANFNSIFVNELLFPSVNSGMLDKLLNILYSSDPNLIKSWKYLIEFCKYLSNNKFYSVLYKIQLFMKDYIRAAMTKINFFYLYPPPSDYIQIYHRSKHLIQARDHCKQYIVSENEIHKGCLHVAEEKVLKQVRTLNLQLEIASKFYENNVKGYFPALELENQTDSDQKLITEQLDAEQNDDKRNELEFSEFVSKSNVIKEPLTLLTESKTKKTYLAALVAVEGSETIFENFNLTKQIIKDNNLDTNLVYRVAAKILINSKKVQILKMIIEFVECIKGSTDQASCLQMCDEFICVCIRHTNNKDLIDPLIKMLHSDEIKINCYISANKLKLAYLLAVKKERFLDINRIMSVASATNQESIRNVCERLLKKFKNNQKNKDEMQAKTATATAATATAATATATTKNLKFKIDKTFQN